MLKYTLRVQPVKFVLIWFVFVGVKKCKMGVVVLNDSRTICRLCGKEQQGSTMPIFENATSTLQMDIAFFLPIQVCTSASVTSDTSAV